MPFPSDDITPPVTNTYFALMTPAPIRQYGRRGR
jgi:hypothetical protein